MVDDNKEAEKQQQMEEMRWIRELMDGVSFRLRQIANQQQESELKLEEAEYQVLMRINNAGLIPAYAVGIASFVMFRTLRARVMRRVAKKLRHQEQRQQQHGPQQQQHQQPSPMEQMIEQRQQQKLGQQSAAAGAGGPVKQSWLGWSSGVFLDGITSFMTAVLASAYFIDMNGLVEELSQVPLSPGHSAIAREVCPVAVDWYGLLQLEAQRGDPATQRIVQGEPLLPITASYLRLAQNCQRRARYEAQLRKEKGVSDPHYRVAIPEPGVPLHDDSVGDGENDGTGTSSSSNVWADEAVFSTESSSGSSDGFGNSDNSDAWADSFVRDQEEEERRRRS